MDALEALTTRRSVRQYKPDPVPPELLDRIVDAGRLAPTSRNQQPWEFVVITEADLRRRIARITDHGKFIADAPVCVAVLTRPTRRYLEDGSAATTNILLAAHALGLGACWVAGDKKPYGPEIVELCGAPAEFELVALIAIGYAAEVPSPSKRRLDEVLHRERFRPSS